MTPLEQLIYRNGTRMIQLLGEFQDVSDKFERAVFDTNPKVSDMPPEYLDLFHRMGNYRTALDVIGVALVNDMRMFNEVIRATYHEEEDTL